MAHSATSLASHKACLVHLSDVQKFLYDVMVGRLIRKIMTPEFTDFMNLLAKVPHIVSGSVGISRQDLGPH